MKKLIILLFLSLFSLNLFAQFSNAPVPSSDSNIGITIIAPDKETKIEPVKYYKTKAGSGAFVAGLTYGATKIKNKNFYKGASSPNKVNEGDKFRFSFGTVPVNLVAQMYMFAPQYTIRNFQLVKLSSKKDHRELVTGELGLWNGYDSGVKESTDIDFEVTVIDDTTYEVTIKSAKPGEYAFVFSDNGIGAYQSIFDFSVPDPKKKN
ncbi:MAG: hypothetical protein K2K25_02955 [Muribaculaceae bacterium]|nr:hypothetical protein [Muribaculaceae bacterium]